MKKLLSVVILLGLLSQSTWASGDREINMIGLDENGQEIELPIKSKFFEKKMTKAVKEINRAVVPALNGISARGGNLSLNMFYFGSYFSLSAGLGPLLKGSVSPYVVLYYK